MSCNNRISNTYDPSLDSFNIWILILPAAILSLIWNDGYTVSSILLSFAMFLDTVAILPQLFIIHKIAKEKNEFVENLTSWYVFCLVGSRAVYLINLVYFCYTQNWFGTSVQVSAVCGIVQIVIYCRFLYYYLRFRVKAGIILFPPPLPAFSTIEYQQVETQTLISNDTDR